MQRHEADWLQALSIYLVDIYGCRAAVREPEFRSVQLGGCEEWSIKLNTVYVHAAFSRTQTDTVTGHAVRRPIDLAGNNQSTTTCN